MSLKLVLNLSEDADLRKSLTEFAHGVFRAIGRDEVLESIIAAARQKLDSVNVEKLTREEIAARFRYMNSDSSWQNNMKTFITDCFKVHAMPVVEKLVDGKVTYVGASRWIYNIEVAVQKLNAANGKG